MIFLYDKKNKNYLGEAPLVEIQDKDTGEYSVSIKDTIKALKECNEAFTLKKPLEYKEGFDVLFNEHKDDWEYSNKFRYNELGVKLAEAKEYLAKTDHKFYNGYKPKEGEDLVEIERLRDEAREFIRANEGGN